MADKGCNIVNLVFGSRLFLPVLQGLCDSGDLLQINGGRTNVKNVKISWSIFTAVKTNLRSFVASNVRKRFKNGAYDTHYNPLQFPVIDLFLA